MFRKILCAAFVASSIAGISAAQGLEAFRAPNDLESSYVGVAAALNAPALCKRISPAALNRVRKPALTRSLCFYHVALAAGEEELCADVIAVPTDTGMMAWLDPQRCRRQVQALEKVQRPKTPPSNLDVFFPAIGYDANDAGADGWQAFLDDQIADPKRSEKLRARLNSAPDFSSEKSAAEGYSAAEAEHEANWVLGRAIRLCVAGKSDAACDQKAIALIREEGLRKVGLLPPAAPSGYRELSETENSFLVLADILREPGLCDAIGKDSLSPGWSSEPGLSFVTSRSACRMRVAIATHNAAACSGVAPISDTNLDGARATADECRKSVAKGEILFPAPRIEPDWAVLLGALGYGADLQRSDANAWSALAARLANPINREHAAFKEQLIVAAESYSVSETERKQLAFSSADLQMKAHQFAATRFHCSLKWDDVASRDPNAAASYWTPEKPTFSLLDQTGKRVTEADYAGKYMLAYFGFTYCPDVCPTSLAAMSEALNELGDDRALVTPAFFTLDAARDTPDVLRDYLGNFGDDFVGFTGTADEIDRAARSFNVYYFAGDVDGVYTLEHTSYFYLVDPDGRTVKYFEYGVNPYDMASEIRAILDGEAPSAGGGVRPATGKTAHKKPALSFGPVTISALLGLFTILVAGGYFYRRKKMVKVD